MKRTLGRREFIRLGAVSVGMAGVGYWIVDRLTDRGRRRPAVLINDAGQQSSSWGRLTRLVDGDGRRAYPVHSILLPSGQVLMIGGAASRFFEFFFDPTVSAHTVTVEPLALPVEEPDDYFECAGHAYVADGRLLLAGGSRSKGGEEGLRYSLLLDTAAKEWTRIGYDMAGGPRWYPAVTRLPDTRLLVTTGFVDFGGSVNRSVELFDPVAHDSGSNPWRELISDEENGWEIESTGEDYTHVFSLPKPVVVDGHLREVVMIGKSGVVHFMNYTSSFAAPNDRFAIRPRSRRPGAATARMLADASSSVLLPDGRIMVVGGSSDPTVQQRADIYDPINDSWESIETGIGRRYPTALLLPDGKVLVVSGEDPPRSGGDPRAPQIIDPMTGIVTTEAAWPERDLRGYHNTAVLLPDGRALLGGGGGMEESTPNNERTDVRCFSPAYLSWPHLRPQILDAPSVMRYGAPYPIDHATGPIHRVTLSALGAMTHCFDQNQRVVELFRGESRQDRLVVSGPADAYVAPPGDYMLFLLRRVVAAGVTVEVPSVARVVRVLADPRLEPSATG